MAETNGGSAVKVTQEQAKDLRDAIDKLEQERAIKKAAPWRVQVYTEDEWDFIKKKVDELPTNKRLTPIIKSILNELYQQSQVHRLHNQVLVEQKRLFDKHEAEQKRLMDEADACAKHVFELDHSLVALQEQVKAMTLESEFRA